MKIIICLFISVSYIKITYGLLQQLSIINCTWPCPNSIHKCIVTANSANCQPLTQNNWVINSPTKAPIYTGATVTIPNESCIPVPLPNLPLATNHSNISLGQSVIQWPILSPLQRPQDEYLGNCGHVLYCDQVCRSRLHLGSTCNSSNQCAYGFCDNSTCHSLNELVDHDDYHATKDHRAVTGVLASIFGIIGASLMIVGGIRFYRYLKNHSIKPQPQPKEEDNEFINDFEYLQKPHYSYYPSSSRPPPYAP